MHHRNWRNWVSWWRRIQEHFDRNQWNPQLICTSMRCGSAISAAGDLPLSENEADFEWYEVWTMKKQEKIKVWKFMMIMLLWPRFLYRNRKTDCVISFFCNLCWENWSFKLWICFSSDSSITRRFAISEWEEDMHKLCCFLARKAEFDFIHKLLIFLYFSSKILKSIHSNFLFITRENGINNKISVTWHFYMDLSNYETWFTEYWYAILNINKKKYKMIC